MPSWTTWPAVAAALVLLNASLSFANVWPTPKITWASALSIELAVCVLVMAAAGSGARRLARHVLPATWVVLVFGHYLDVTAPGLYGRDFNLYWDSQHLGNVAAMLARAVPAWQIAAAAIVFAALIGAIWWFARVALGAVAAAVAEREPRIVLGTLALAVLAVFATPPRPDGSHHGVRFAPPVVSAYARQARFVVAMGSATAPSLGESPRLESGLDGLGGADVLLAFVEAYGAVTYDNPAFAESLSASRTDLQAAAAESGRVVVSALVESPTFGASSWLAHLSLLTGVDVRDQYAYVAVMASTRDTLPKAFARQGYRSVALMPGMRQAWPEGAFYGFDAIYGRDGLDYRGPKFGWWSIPDQYALARFDALELADAPRKPVFAVFPTSTTHAPFGPVPPYQRDWSRILSATPFDEDEVDAALAANPDLTNLGPSYARAVAYDLTAFAGYVREHADDNLVLILIGDHQPVAAVSGTGASWLVPMHVVARPGLVVDRLRAAGFEPGLEPSRPGVGSMHALVPTLWQAFGGHGGVRPASRGHAGSR